MGEFGFAENTTGLGTVGISDVPWWKTALTIGSQDFNSFLQYKALTNANNNNSKAGFPSLWPSGTAGGVSALGNFLPLIIILVVVVVVISALKNK